MIPTTGSLPRKHVHHRVRLTITSPCPGTPPSQTATRVSRGASARSPSLVPRTTRCPRSCSVPGTDRDSGRDLRSLANKQQHRAIFRVDLGPEAPNIITRNYKYISNNILRTGSVLHTANPTTITVSSYLTVTET